MRDAQIIDWTVWLTEQEPNAICTTITSRSYSVGEAARLRGAPAAARIGHGALAERALLPVLPSVEEFPYALRLVSVRCSLPTVPLQPGLHLRLHPGPDGRWRAHQGPCCRHLLRPRHRGRPLDDHAGHSGSWKISTATWTSRWAAPTRASPPFRWIIKVHGLTSDIIEEAFEKMPQGPPRISWTRSCCPVIAEPRAELSKYAPKMVTIKIDVDKIKRCHRQGRQGHSGDSVPNCNCKIDVDEDGSVFISAPLNSRGRRACPAHHQDHRGGPGDRRHL